MPVVGLQEAAAAQAQSAGTSYRKNALYEYAQTFAEQAKDILKESHYDLFEDPVKVLRRKTSRNSLKSFFVENSYDTNPLGMDLEEQEDYRAQMEQQFENDANAILENANLGDYNPVVGMALPIHKNILMNMVFDKGAIDKVTTASPKFTISMETRILVAPDGTEIDMFTEQNKMTAAINEAAPIKMIKINLPEYEATDVVNKLGGTSLDHLSIITEIAAIKVSGLYYDEGDILPSATNTDDTEGGYVELNGTKAEASTKGAKDTWFRVDGLQFKPAYGDQYDRSVIGSVVISGKVDNGGTAAPVDIVGTISASMKKDKFIITAAVKPLDTSVLESATTPTITAIRLKTRLDTSNAMRTPASVKWKVDTILEEIPEAMPINTTISPEEVKDLAALYQVNQLTKVMSLFKTSLANYKDDTIKAGLDESYEIMPVSNKLHANFDFIPRDGYALDPVEWRHKTFFDYLDTKITKLIQVLNDPNMTVSVFGDPDIVRRITPSEYRYVAPSNIGPVEIDFTRTIATSDKRVYNFFGSDKMRGQTELIVILNPRNTDRIIYRIYDYQMYVSNEIRNINNPALPAIHAFERWKLVSYQPVQGRIEILNPTGYKEEYDSTTNTYNLPEAHV